MPKLKTASTRRAKRRDKIARWIITLGGVTVIASVIAILALIVGVTLPLFRAPTATAIATCRLPGEEPAEGANGLGQAKRGPTVGPAKNRNMLENPGGAALRLTHPTPLPKGEGTPLRLGIDAAMNGTNVTGFVWFANGSVAWVDLRTGKLVGQERVPPPAGNANNRLRSVEPLDAGKYSLAWSDGAASLVEIVAQPPNRKDAKAARYVVRSLAGIPMQSTNAKPRPVVADRGALASCCFIRRSDSRAITRAALLSNGTIAILRQSTAESAMGEDEVSTHESVLRDDIIPHIRTMTMDHEGKTLYAGTDNGRLLRWQLDEKGDVDNHEVVRAFPDGRSITALALLLGDVSLAVGDAGGEVTVWSPVNSDGTRKLQLVHRLQPHQSAIQEILTSARNKSILSLSNDGVVNLDYMTSERHLLTIALCGAGVPPAKKEAGETPAPQDKAGETPAPQDKAGETPAPQDKAGETPALRVALGPRGDALLAMDGAGALTAWQIDCGYPEISFQTLFGKVQYEGYDQPEYVWQTTGGEDFEPKFSLVPLIFGTLKGTFYAMFFAVPLALFGAMYVSYFASPELRGFIKPIIEVMATVPSVVIGFLIALWLAPILQDWLFAFFLGLVVVPAAFVSFMVVWQLVRKYRWAKWVERGYEVFAVLLIVAPVAAGVTIYLAPRFERGLFGGTHRWEILAIFAAMVVIPAALFLLGAIWRAGPTFKKVRGGYGLLLLLGKYLLLLATMALGAAIIVWSAGFLESHLFSAGFSGNFRDWLGRGPLGMQYDQRNCIIIAFGLGFTVIPIIFSISEDSLSNVPYSMTAASMAVGASRWQTLWRVVLPSASPGIFAAMMIGFGRAVGETMIVLMATGNTPMMSGSPFNGMRTLAANIAVESPEAPVGGTLYRVLFLCAVLLFMLTFIVNTVAELVRQRLRKRFGRF